MEKAVKVNTSFMQAIAHSMIQLHHSETRLIYEFLGQPAIIVVSRTCLHITESDSIKACIDGRIQASL